MKKARVGELRNGLSKYLSHVRAGGTVVVFDRDQPVAHIIPVPAAPRRARDADRLARLERQGLVRRGRGSVSEWLRAYKPRRGNTGALKALLDERRSGW
jgi:antitoxin (DNA-binding transcriptional repressor) of toxin-antitoxin stability system